MTECLLRTVFLWQFVHCKKSSSAVSYRQKPELHTSLEQQFCRYTFPRVFLNFLLIFPQACHFPFIRDFLLYRTPPADTAAGGVLYTYSISTDKARPLMVELPAGDQILHRLCIVPIVGRQLFVQRISGHNTLHVQVDTQTRSIRHL